MSRNVDVIGMLNRVIATKDGMSHYGGMSTKTKDELKQDVEKVLEVLREGLALHGGNVELVDVLPEQGIAQVRLQGSCVGCPMSAMTLKMGIEETVKEMVPEITEVVEVE